MTTQVLISDREALSQSFAKSLKADALSGSSSDSSSDYCLDRRPASLPYQVNHQVELLHLQAETEALLQHLKTLKQQKIAI